MSWVATPHDDQRSDNILSCHGLNPAAQRAHIGLYRVIMYGESPLTRAEREMLAVCVSAVNNCHY